MRKKNAPVSLATALKQKQKNAAKIGHQYPSQSEAAKN